MDEITLYGKYFDWSELFFCKKLANSTEKKNPLVPTKRYESHFWKVFKSSGMKIYNEDYSWRICLKINWFLNCNNLYSKANLDMISIYVKYLSFQSLFWYFIFLRNKCIDKFHYSERKIYFRAFKKVFLVQFST